MSNFTITFKQTNTANVDVVADSLQEAQELASKRITRQGFWGLADSYIVDGEIKHRNVA